MSNRINAYIVTLDKDIREDDAEPILNAIRMISHVRSVKPNVSTISDHIAESRVRQELGEKLWKVLYPKTSE